MKHISHLDLSGSSCVSKEKKQIPMLPPLSHSPLSILAKLPKSKHGPEIFNYDFQIIRKKKIKLKASFPTKAVVSISFPNE